jgi:YD repeat-containing protein
MKVALAIVITIALSAPALAQSRTFYDSAGRVTGKSTTDSGGSTTFYDASGRVTGRTSAGSNGTTTIYDASGRAVGRVTPRAGK